MAGNSNHFTSTLENKQEDLEEYASNGKQDELDMGRRRQGVGDKSAILFEGVGYTIHKKRLKRMKQGSEIHPDHIRNAKFP